MASDGDQFDQLARKRQSGLIEEFRYLLWNNKKWWLLPILVVFCLLGMLVVLGSTGAAPYIYTLF